MKDILIKPILRIIAFHSWLYILAQEGPTHKTGSKTPGAPAAPKLPQAPAGRATGGLPVARSQVSEVPVASGGDGLRSQRRFKS